MTIPATPSSSLDPALTTVTDAFVAYLGQAALTEFPEVSVWRGTPTGAPSWVTAFHRPGKNCCPQDAST